MVSEVEVEIVTAVLLINVPPAGLKTGVATLPLLLLGSSVLLPKFLSAVPNIPESIFFLVEIFPSYAASLMHC